MRAGNRRDRGIAGGLDAAPGAGLHRLDHVYRRDVAQVAVGDRQGGVPQRVADNVDRGALTGEFGGVGVSEAVGVYAPVDVGFAREAWQQVADI